MTDPLHPETNQENYKTKEHNMDEKWENREFYCHLSTCKARKMNKLA